MLMNLILVGLGGSFGSLCRYLVGVGYMRLFGPVKPYLATLFINVLGGLLMGVLAGFLAHRGVGGERWRLLLGVGVLGGFTTFSAFSLEAVMLLERKAYDAFAGYVVGSTALSILALMLGLFIARRVFA